MNDLLKPKLVWTPVNSEYRFSIIDKNYVINNSLFMIVGENLELLCCLFNSKLFQYYTKLVISSGKYNYGSSSIFLNINIKLDFTVEMLNELLDLYEKISTLNLDEDTLKLNQIIYGHYSISLEEIDLINSEI